MSELKSLTLNGRTYDSFPDKSSVKTINGRTPDGNGDLDLSDSVYDLKEGYGYAEDIYIEEDGTETAMPGRNYKCFDFIPVKNGISYTLYGCGFALYDSEKNFLYARYAGSGINTIESFTPTKNGFVRLTINCEDASYARFCKTAEMHLEPCDYEEKPSPFFDPRIPCNVHLYGDSASEGLGLQDTSKAWSNRLGALITSMKRGLYNRRFAAFTSKTPESPFYILNDTGYLRFTAYTDFFGLTVQDVEEINVYIDGQEQPSIVSGGSKAFGFDEYGSHTIELYGRSGQNIVSTIVTRKLRTFENHAVSGYLSRTGLPAYPDGNVSIVMFGTNDRMDDPGMYYKTINDFVSRCKSSGGVAYVFTPVPIPPAIENDASYRQTLSDVIAQLPTDYISIYEELQLAEMLLGESIYIPEGQNGAYHPNELGHKILYAAAASKLQLAPAMSELLPYFGGASGNGGSYTLPVATANTLGGVKPVAKTEDMTQSVGVDELGGLWTAAGSGGSSSGGIDTIVDFTTTEDTTEIRIPIDTEEMAEKLSNASDMHITLYIPRDTADTETTTKGTAEVGIYKGHDYTIAKVTDAIQAPTTDYSNFVTTHIVVFSTAYSTTKQREPAPVLIAKKPDGVGGSYELKGCLLYEHQFNVGNYIFVKGSQNMPAGTQLIMGVRV